MRGGSPALLLAGGAAVLTLYNRGVWHAAWASLFGPDVPLLAGNPAANISDNGVVAPGSGSIGDFTDEWTASGCNRGNYSCLNAWKASLGSGTTTGGRAGDALARAEATVSGQLSPGGSGDWIDWCLNWVRRVRATLTGNDPGGVYGLPTAQAACNASRLIPGLAPRGANVCFRSNHIGISNGDGTYTSVGIQHGGPITLPYANNPNYTGWFA